MLWCLAIRHAVVTGELDICSRLRVAAQLTDKPVGLDLIPEAEQAPRPTSPQRLGGSRVSSGVVVDQPYARANRRPCRRRVLRARHLQARAPRLPYAQVATPTRWPRSPAPSWGPGGVRPPYPRCGAGSVHGWPGLTGGDLADRGLVVARGGPDANGWPLADRIDNSELRGGRAVRPASAPSRCAPGRRRVLDALPAEVDAIVSSVPRRPSHAGSPSGPREHLQVWLVDLPDPAVQPEPRVGAGRHGRCCRCVAGRGPRTVLLHCVAAQSRHAHGGGTRPTPSAISEWSRALAVQDVCGALADANPNAGFSQSDPTDEPGR